MLNYISKYASKIEKKLETYNTILKKIAYTNESDDNALIAYQNFMMGFIAERDIGAQETCHMLQKLPLVLCSRPFITLNVSKKILHRINNSNNKEELGNNYIQSYIECPIELDSISLIDTAQMYTFSKN